MTDMRSGADDRTADPAHRGRRLRDHALDRRPLAVPEFRRLWTASLVAAVGGSFAVIVVPAQLFQLTGSSAAVGMSAAVSFSALVVSSLVSGALADTMDRRRLLLFAHTALTLTYVLFWLQGVLHLVSVTGMLLLVAVQGLSLGSIMTTMGAAVPRVVPADLLTAAAGLSSLNRWAGSIAGPLLAGVLLPVMGSGTLFLLDSAALLVVLRAVFRLPPMPSAVPSALPSRTIRTPAARLGVVRPMLEGFRYLAAQPVLLAVMGVDLAAMVFGMPYSLFPEMAVQAFGEPEGGGPALGLLYAAYPVGVLTVGLVSGTFTRTRRYGTWLITDCLAWGVSVMLFGLAPRLGPALVALALGGGVNFVLSTFRNAITQAYTDDARRGRIQGSLTVLVMGGPHLAGVLHGLASPLIGLRATVFAGGALATLAAGGIALAVPQLRRYQAPPAR